MAVVSVAVVLMCVLVSPSLTAPAKTYDQRQQGDLNIHAQLDNIVVVVIPSAKLNLLQLALSDKLSGEKGGFLQLLQKLYKTDIDRYDTIKEDEEPQTNLTTEDEFDIELKSPLPVITTPQQVSLNHEEENGEKDEEVVATVQEMKPDPIEKTTETQKVESIDNSNIKKQTVTATVQESVLTVTMPADLKDEEIDEEKQAIESFQSDNVKTEIKQTVQLDLKVKSSNELEKTSTEKMELPEKEYKPSKTDDTSKTSTPKVPSVELSKEKSPTIEDIIKPVAAKEEITPESSALKSSEPKKSVEPVRLQEGVRREKVIRYKPESKWAPELVDLLGPPRPKPKEIQERHMFADLCSPGSWDPELRTCIMPGETRSRSELARFLNAMRFGISVPK